MGLTPKWLIKQDKKVEEMKVLQTIHGMNAGSGGPSTCTFNLLESMYVKRPGEVNLLTFDSQEVILGRGRPWLKLVENDCRTPLAISANFKRAIKNEFPDLYHCNALWMYDNHITCRIARERQKPYVLSPHGMIYKTALSVKAWKKRPMLSLWFRNDIMKASALHATCVKEMENIRAFGYGGPIAVIPNPIEIPDDIADCSRSDDDVKRIGFLGRIHPIKGIENLIRGLSLSKNKEVRLIIMGQGEPEYEEQLRELIRRLNLANRVEFTGFINGRDRFKALASICALFVPSVMENFGMIVPEALLVGTPVMASLGTPWEELNSERCGWWEERSPDNIAGVIDEITSMPKAEREAMGQRGHQLVMRKYTGDSVADKMIMLYRWLLGEVSKPNYVYS